MGECRDLNPRDVIAVDENNHALDDVTAEPGEFCFQSDTDGDGIPDDLDNFPSDYNPVQEDSHPPQGNGCGDVCECEGNFDGDLDVDAMDAIMFKIDYGRMNCPYCTFACSY